MAKAPTFKRRASALKLNEPITPGAYLPFARVNLSFEIIGEDVVTCVGIELYHGNKIQTKDDIRKAVRRRMKFLALGNSWKPVIPEDKLEAARLIIKFIWPEWLP